MLIEPKRPWLSIYLYVFVMLLGFATLIYIISELGRNQAREREIKKAARSYFPRDKIFTITDKSTGESYQMWGKVWLSSADGRAVNVPAR